MKVRYIGESTLWTKGNEYKAHALSTGNFSTVTDGGNLCVMFANECKVVNESESDPIVESVINQFKTRSEIGIKKYGTTLERNDLSTLDWLKHLQEEMMDAVLYIERLKQEFKTKE